MGASMGKRGWEFLEQKSAGKTYIWCVRSGPGTRNEANVVVGAWDGQLPPSTSTQS
jgi:hypothetical protein